jgi:hypothetical protein
VPVAIPVTVSSLPRTSKTPQPADLDFDHYEESEEPSDWSMPSPSPISKPISSLAQIHDNMSWYTPNGSATPTSFLAQTFYCSLYAGTVATVTRFATAAAYTARAKATTTSFNHFSFDIPGAFLQVPLTTETSPVDCYIKFPANIPHPCAGKWFQRFKSTYGSKNANALFADDFTATLNTAGFFSNPCDEKLFTRFNPIDPSDSCSVCIHVDDGEGWSTNPSYVQELHAVLNRRYGEIE